MDSTVGKDHSTTTNTDLVNAQSVKLADVKLSEGAAGKKIIEITKPNKQKRLIMAHSTMSFEEEMRPVTYCGNVGWEGTVVLSWYLVVIGCFVYILREYTA